MTLFAAPHSRVAGRCQRRSPWWRWRNTGAAASAATSTASRWARPATPPNPRQIRNPQSSQTLTCPKKREINCISAFRTHQEIRSLADDNPNDPPGVRVECGHGLLLHEAGSDPGPGPELRLLTQSQRGGEWGVREEVSLQELMKLLKHRGGYGTDDGIIHFNRHFHCQYHWNMLCQQTKSRIMCHSSHRKQMRKSTFIMMGSESGALPWYLVG